MWLNSIRSMLDNKPLSSIELLVLATVSEETLNAAQIVEKLNNSSLMWQGQSGTLYPILHRLRRRGLLVASGSRGTNFNRSKVGTALLDRSLNPLGKEITESQNYFLTVLNELVQQGPMGIHEFFDDMIKITEEYLIELKKLQLRADKISDDSVEVEVKFE